MRKLLSVLFVLLCVIFTNVTADADTADSRIFRFYTGKELYQLLAVKEGENLPEPAAPAAPEGQRFEGWYADEACTKPFSFGIQNTRNSTTTVYAKFIQTFCFTYYDELGNVLLNEELVSGSSYTFDKEHPAYAVTAIDKVNSGWKDQHGTVHTTETIAVTEDMNLEPVPETGYYARFFTQGGSFVHSQLILPGQKAERPEQDPTRAGYTFDNWYTEAAGGSVFDFDTVPTQAADIYAHWTANTDTPYKVVLWVENTDGGYDYGASITKTGTTGGDVAFDPATDAASGALYEAVRVNSEKYRNRKYVTHIFLDDKNTASISEVNQDGGIQGDGTTVLNVYARLKRYKLELRKRDTGELLVTIDDAIQQTDYLTDVKDLLAEHDLNRWDVYYGSTSFDTGMLKIRLTFPQTADGCNADLPDGATIVYRLYKQSGNYTYRREILRQDLDNPSSYNLAYSYEYRYPGATDGATQADDPGFRVDHGKTTGQVTGPVDSGPYHYSALFRT